METRARCRTTATAMRGLTAGLVLVAGALREPPSPASAQETPAAALREGVLTPLRWRNIGPNRGGRSIAVAGSTSRPLEYYFGATGGGLWKSTNGGDSWAPVTDGQINSASVGAIGVCEANPDVVYIGTGEAQLRNPINMGDGVYGTRDAGKTWTHLGLESSTGQQAVARVRVHPTDCDLVYAAVLGDPYGPNPERGVFRSRDGGRSWQKVLFRSERAGASDLVLDPGDPRTLYATIWEVQRRPWGPKTGEASGIFKSTDGGDSWQDLTRNPGLPRVRIGKVGISVSGAEGGRVYAVVESDSGGVFRSDDGGATWERSSGHRFLTNRAEYYNRIYADPVERDRVYVMNAPFFRSTDGGETYTQVRVPHGDNHDLWIDPRNPQRMINGNDGGANVSTDGGRTWTQQEFPTSQLYHVATTSHFPYHVCGAQQDNTTACVPSDGDGSYLYHAAGGESGYIAPHPQNSSVYYAGSIYSFLTRYDRSTGQARNIQVWPMHSQGESAGQQRERFQWTFPIVISPHDPNTVYVSSQHLWRTRNGGQSWERISPDLTRADPETLKGSELIVRNQNSMDYYATVFTVAPSKLDPNTIWTGSDDGLIHVTRDGGESWSNVTPPDLPEFSKSSMLEASAHAPGRAYLAAIRNKLQDVAPYVYRTDDHGRTWTKITSGIASRDYVHAVREDPQRAGLLYAATEHGVYVSLDDGASWGSLSLNLPDVPVTDLVVKDNDLVISTFGRSFFVLEGLDLLRQLTPQQLERRASLFRPADPIRTLSMETDGNRTTISGANRLAVYYHLRQPAQRVTVEIVSPSGEVIQSFSGTPGQRPRAVVRDAVGAAINTPAHGWAPIPPVPATAPGTHLLSWDLRYPGATTFEGMLIRGGGTAEGPMSPPGEYSVRLTVDGETQTQPFRIRMDPRLTDVTEADLQEQFRFARQIHRRLDEATSAVARIREIKRQVTERTATPDSPYRGNLGTTLLARLSEVEEALYPVGAEAQKDPLHFGGRLANKLASLQHGAVESADARPTDQSYEVFRELSAQLDQQLERLESLLRSDLDQLNAALREHRLTPVTLVQPRDP